MRLSLKFICTVCTSSLILLTNAAHAQSICKVLDPDIAETYKGGCKDGLADGRGEAKGKDSYVGNFRAGLPHGKGTYVWHLSGNRYEGDWVNGKRTGKGITIIQNNQRYEGEYLNDARHGKGVMSWNENNRNCGLKFCFKSFVGEYKNNKPSCGYAMFWNGDSYDGCFNEKEEMVGDTKFKTEENNKRFERVSRCQHLYQGRVFKRENFFGHLNYVVIGFSPNQGLATVKAEHDGSFAEILCSDIPE